MDIVREFTAQHRAYWQEYETAVSVFTAPGEEEAGIEPALAIVTEARDECDLGQRVIRVAFKPDEIDLAHLARGGTIWISFVGYVPVHGIEVQPPDDERRRP
jgi:hypothetical protein